MGPAGWGAVYKIDTYSGAISTFALLPNAQDGSLGSITYEFDHEQFFVSNFGDGRIYRLDMSGAIIDFYDHGTPWNGNGGWTALGDRPWAVEAHDGRLYYSLWNEDLVNYTSTSANEVWSIKLDPAGGPPDRETLCNKYAAREAYKHILPHTRTSTHVYYRGRICPSCKLNGKRREARGSGKRVFRA